MSIKAISFDFWNTLFEEAPGAFRFYYERRRALLIQSLAPYGDFSPDQVDQAFQSEASEHLRIWTEEHRTLCATERIEKVLGNLRVSLPLGTKAELVTACEEGILERPPVLVSGAHEVVTTLARRYRLGIISDVGFSPGRVLKKLLRESGLIDLFDSLTFSDEAGRSKPHIGVFDETARRLDASPGEIAHIGDLERTDVLGAKSAGYYAVRFTGVTPMGEDEFTQADHVISSLHELPALIEVL